MNDSNDFWSRLWRDGSIASALAGLAITGLVAAAKTAFTDPEDDHDD